MPLPPPANPSRSLQHNLPAEVAGFIGRDQELKAIHESLFEFRLVTLTGTGGSGKTRLALRTALSNLRDFPDGVWLVQFAPITDSTLVPRAVAAALGVRGTPGRPLLAALADSLIPRRILLVFDNCEHLIGACARVAETLLRSCPHLRILATSREALRIPGEVTRRVPPLELPKPGSLPSLESLARIGSVALFVERAREHMPDFTLTEQNASTVVAICNRLDGLPLGIELAAALVGTLSLDQIADRLDDSIRLLGGGDRTLPRQETMRATLDWSHALLSDEQRILFRRLAVFAGGFNLTAAEIVCCGRGIDHADVLGLLTALVNKSLLESHIHAREARYRLLEPVRQYASEHLAAQSETKEMQRRHADYYLEVAESAEPRLLGGTRGPWIERLGVEQDNLRAALAWSRNQIDKSDGEIGLRLAGALFWYWNFRGEVSEGLDWVEAALVKSPRASSSVRAKALYAAGEMAWMLGQNALARLQVEESEELFRAIGDTRGLAFTLQSLPLAIDHPRAREAVEESIRLFEEIGDEWGLVLAWTGLDLIAWERGDPCAQLRFEGTLARWKELGDDWGAAHVLNILGDFARTRDDPERARACYEEGIILLRRQGLTGTLPSLLHNLGYVALRQANIRQALRLFRESLVLFRNQGDQRGIAECLAGLAGVLSILKQPERAARLFGTAESIFESINASVWPANASDYAQNLATVRAQLDEDALQEAWASGRVTSVVEAIEEALAAGPTDLPLSDRAADLTPREREVAVLVAKGLKNRQIGAALFITEGTAGLHVKHILHKLDFSTRAQVVRWAVECGLVTGPGENNKP